MSLEKHFSLGKNFLIAGSLAILLSSCESIFELPKKTAVEVYELGSRLAELSMKPFSFFIKENSREGCTEISNENLEERTCRIYLEEEVYGAKEEYLGILKIREKPSKQARLILGYFNGDNFDMDGNKNMVVVEYKGKDFADFVEPEYAKLDYPAKDFETFFENPVENEFDSSDNQLARVQKKNLVSRAKLYILQEMLHERMRDALKLIDERSVTKENFPQETF